MTKKEKLEFDRLARLLEAERERSNKSFEAYRDLLWENVDMKMKIERIEAVLRGEE